MTEPIASRLAAKFASGMFFLAPACDSGHMKKNEWYVLVRSEGPGECWTCVGNISKDTAMVLQADFLKQDLECVLGFSFPTFCGCESRVVAA